MVVSMCLWGLSWPSSKVMTHFCSPINLTAYRYILVVASLAIALPFFKGGYRIHKSGALFVIVSGVLLAVYSYFTFKGLSSGTAGAGGVLVTVLNPVFAYFIGIVLSKRPPSRNESIGLLLGLVAGATLLHIWDNLNAILASGNLYFLLAAITWAVMSKFTSKAGRYGTSVAFSFWQYVVCLVCVGTTMDYSELGRTLSTGTGLLWFNLFFNSVIVTAIATTVFFYTTTRLGAERASSFLFLVPFAAALSALIFLGEHIEAHTIMGGLTGIVAVYFINRKSFPDKRKGMMEEVLPGSEQ